MAFFRQLKLLLWKNGLVILRQPLWSLTLIAWPVIIFIIIAVTRHQFPPILKDTCFVGPRNLPSTGFFPFLETLMCNTDSSCNNKSHSVDPAALKSTARSRGSARSNLLSQGTEFFNLSLPKSYRNDSAALIEALSNILGPSYHQSSNNGSHVNWMNASLPGDQEALHRLLESMNMLKRAICTMTVPMMNTTSHSPLSYAVVTFCKSDDTVFEVSLNTLNKILTELMLTKPNETMIVAGAAVMVVNQLQNQTSLWESLLAIPQLFSSGSVDQALDSTEALLTNIQGAMHVIQSNFPEVGASLSTVHPFLAGGINLIRYAQNWPGRDVSISLGDVVTLQGNSISDLVKRVLQEVKIPLDKAISLTLDKDMVHSHLCDNSSNPLWLTAACSTGTVDMLLGWISPDKVAKQVLLVWSERVAPHDVSFAKGLLHSLMGGPSPGGGSIRRTRRSMDTQPQNIEEELFLGVGRVVMEIIKIVPELDMVVQATLRTGYQSMKAATLALEAVEDMIENILEDADQLQKTYLMLLTNQSAASVWISRVLDSVMEIVPKIQSTQPLTCEGLLGPFEWLLNTDTIKIEVWRSAICQNNSALQQALLMDWLPLIQKAQDVYSTLIGQGNYNVTLPMILSEWHKLYNKSMQFGMLSNKVATQLSGAYWMNWMSNSSAHNVTETLQQSVFLSMVSLGEKIEKSQLWPEVKDYFHMFYWILNYRPGVTTQPANCSIDINVFTIHCETGLKWPLFIQAMTQALMSPSQDVLVNCLKGTVNLLQHAYGEVYKHLLGTYLKQEIKGGDALSDFLINLMRNLDGFVNAITMLPDQSIANPDVMTPLISNLLQSTGLRPLLPLLLSDGPFNVSAVLDVASKLGRLNQHIFTFNETDPALPELERLIMLFLSLEGNLTMSLSHIMGHTVLTYSDYFHPDYVARLRQAIHPFTNQTSAGFVEAILSAMELLKKMLDAPNGDPTNIILGYIRQLQEFLKSLYRLRKIQYVPLPNGQLSPAQVTDLHSQSKDLLDLLTPKNLQGLIEAGPDAAQSIVIQIFVAFLPPEVQDEATRFLQDFKALQYQIVQCAAGQNCLTGISGIFTFLDQVVDLMLSANGNVTITLASTNLVLDLERREYEEITSLFFPLLLSSNDASYVQTFKQALHFIKLIMVTPNITVSDVQNALRQSNLTLGELNDIAALAGAANINGLIGNILQIINARQCFEPQPNPMVTAQCVVGLISGLSRFLVNLPALRNETAILSFIPLIVNNTLHDVIPADFSSYPNVALAHILNRTMDNIKMNLQLNQLYTPEIMKEISVVEGLIGLVASTEPFNNLNATLLMDPLYAQKVYLMIAEWYLKRLETITNTSSASQLLAPFYYLTQMQLTLQLAQVDYSVFISRQVESLMNSLQHQIDGAGVRKIGLTIVEILRQQFDLIKLNLEAQNNIPGAPPPFNTTVLHNIELQVKLYLDIIEKWMKQPNVLSVLSNMLQWGNPSINVSTPVTDIQHLLETMVNVLSADQQAYLFIIGNITKSLNKALMVAEQPGGLQSDPFLAAILEAVQKAMQILTAATGPLPLSVQQNVLEIVKDSVKLIVQPNISFASSRDMSLLILKRAESIINQTVPEIAEYLLPALKVATMYFESISVASGQDIWNQLILDSMKTVQGLLPPNNPAQAYISTLINITHFILESGQGNMSLWASFENASVENLPMILGQSSDFLAAIIQRAIQTLTGTTGPLPLSVQQNIMEIVQNSLKLTQPGISFASSRDISLLILKRTESLINQTLPEIAEYLLPALKVGTEYFETISAASGPNIWNQLILDTMETVQGLLPPNSPAQVYISTLINVTHFILESGQGNMSLWASFENASVENLPMIFGQSVHFLAAIIQSAIQTLTGTTGPLPLSVQQNILEIVQNSLKLIQPGISFASSRDISLLILKRAESLINQTLPEIAEYLLPALKVATEYFETISAASGPNIWNQLILDTMKTVQSLLPPNSPAQVYVSTLINVTHFILESGQGNMSLWASFENASVENLPMIFGQNVHFLAGIIQSAIQTLTGTTGPLPLSVQQNILEIVQNSLKLTQPGISFASSRDISLLILKRAESLINQTLPEIAEYLLPALKVATEYFETISAASGPNIWNQLILDTMETVQGLLPPNSPAQVYISTLINVTHFILESGQGNMSLWASFENASVENLPMIFGQSVHFLAAIIQSAIQTLTGTTGPLPLSVQQNIMEIVQDSLKLIQPGISFASSRDISLLILKRAESLINQTLPEIAEYLLPALKVATEYFETISAASGPNIWNQLILDEMKIIQSLLPPNSPAQVYVSTLINVTHFILESGQGNMSLWASFENASLDNLPMIFGQMGNFLSMLWPIIVGGPGSPISAPSLGLFAHLAPVLEQVMTGKANQHTWYKLEKILEALLSTLKVAGQLDPSVIPLLEKIVGSIVKNTQAENALIRSLQMPLMTLIREITQSVNSSRFNLADVSERMLHAIEFTLKAAEQANGTLECSEVLKAWEPVREAAGLSHATMAMWCSISLQPILQAWAAEQTDYTQMNMSHMGGGPMNVSTASARIVKAVRFLYQANINNSLVIDRFMEAISYQLFQLAGRPLSYEAQLHLYRELQDVQLQNSLSSFKMLSDELVSLAPFIQPYVEAMEKALRHISGNYHLIQDSSSSQKLFREAALIFLTASNITSDDIFSMMWGDTSGLDAASLNDMLRQGVRLVIDMKVFGDVPMVYQALEQFLASNDSSVIVQKLTAMLTWLTSTQASGLDLLTQVLPKIYDILRPFFSVLTQMGMDMPANMEQFEDLVGDILAMLRQFVTTSGLMTPNDYHPSMYQQGMTSGNHTGKIRNRREAPFMMPRDPMNFFIDLIYIDYPAMFKAISVPVSTAEIMETVHMFFANPDLSVVLKGATSSMPWDLGAPREKTIDAVLGALSFFTLPAALQMSSVDLLANAVNVLPADFPFSSALKNITRALASESQESLMLMQDTLQKAAELFLISLTDPRFGKQLDHLRSQVCILEETQTVRQLMTALSLEPGQLCHTFLPSLQILVESLMMNTTALTDAIFQTFIGDPKTYHVQSNWSSVMTRGLGFNTSSLSSFNISVTSPGAVTVGEMMRDKAAFLADVQQHMNFDPAALRLLMESTLPKNNLEILSWLVNLRHCSSIATLNLKETDVVILKTFCSLSAEQWYSFSLLMTRHLNIEKLIYRMVLSEELQSLVGIMLHVAEMLTNMMDRILPAIGQLQNFMLSIHDLNLPSNAEFKEMMRGQRSKLSSQATFVTLSRALCSKGIMALLGIAQLPAMPESNTFSDQHQRDEMIKRFKIPQDASPFCMNLYLDMVNTTGGAIAWAFLKPMLMGHILYSPDTPTTRAIMEKANATLKEFGNLGKYSKEWIESSDYIIKSAEILGRTLPMLQNSLGNSFVVNFIEMQTDISVGRMKETLSNFSNMTTLLEKNKHIMKQITTLSTLMMNISSCIKFDRYRGYNSTKELDTVAQDLAKNRDLYASVIFKLPKDKGSSRNRLTRSSSTSPLPPKVSYTIRMHMDNVMRTDRVRNPYFVKYNHISARLTLRYNRGFIYLQENIDRAIIETQAGHRVAEPAVQLQPFPYPCYYRDEYLEAISFVFPLMLMIAWVLFVADFVKKLVYERELRLHEYMKMMGVNPLSHFFAWFLECAAYLVLTIFFLTLVLKYGRILPNSDGFLLFLFLCDYGLSIVSFSYLVSSFFDKTYIAGLSGSLLYILCFFPFIVVLAVETKLTFSQKSALSLFSPTCFSYASQYVSRYETQGEGIHWSNSYSSPIAGDGASFGWLCWMMLIDSILYFFIGAYIRMVFPGNYGIPAPWYFPFKASFWADLCCCIKSNSTVARGLLFTNIMQKNQPVFSDDKGKGQSTLSSQAGEDFSELPVGVALHGLSKIYGNRVAIQNLNVSFYEGHVTSLLGHNGAGKTTTMSLLTGLFAPSSGTIEVYGRDMQTNIDDVRRQLGVCMQYDVLFDHMTTKEHLLLYGQIKAPQWSRKELNEQVRTILEETGMYAHRHKRVGTLSGGMKRKLSISIAFIGGSRLVVLDEPTTGVDPCSRRNIWDIVIQYKKHRTVIMSTHHLDEAEVLSDRIAFLERGGLKCCGSPFYLKDKLGQGYKLTLTKKMHNLESEQIDSAYLKDFIQTHVPEARLKEAQGGDLVYSLPPFTSSNASSYRSLLTALDSNLDALQLGGYGISDTTLEEVFLQLTHGHSEDDSQVGPLSISEMVSDRDSMDSFPSASSESISNFGDNIKLTGSSMVSGMALAWQQMSAILIKRFHHSRRDWKGLISQIVLPVLFVAFAMSLGSIRSDVLHYPELELSPALYNLGPSYSFFSNQNPNSARLMDAMMSFPGIDNACLDKSDNPVCTRSTNKWRSSGNSSKAFSVCKCFSQKQICEDNSFQPPHKKIPSSQIVYNLSAVNTENYLVATANDFIRNRYGGFSFGMPLPPDLKMDLRAVPKNRTLSKVWYNPEGYHTMPAYLNSLSNLILRSNLPADKDPRKYAISVSSHPYFGRPDDEDSVVQGMLQILLALCVLTGYSITTASFAIYEVNEHHSGSKRLQHISGIGEPFYWAVNFFYDMAIYLIPVTLTVGVIAAFQIPAFTDRQNLGAVTLLLVLFGFATFPWMYLLAGVFKDAEMAFITYVCINLFISINTILSTSILFFLSQISSLNPEAILDIFNKLSNAFLIFPQFSFGNGLMKLARINIEVQLLSGYGIDAYKNPFSIDALGWMFIASFIQGVVFFTLRLLINRFLIRKVRRLICGRKAMPQGAYEDEDEDVAAEHQRVSSGAASTDILQVNQLTKIYQHLRKKVHAVKKLSVGIPAGECFGLLGENGAGKTTTFKMLTGDVSPTDGTAQIRDWDGRLVDIMECRNEGINIGYCPQVDALDNLLTGKEHLYFYARIRGIAKREIDGVVNYLLKRLELSYHRDIITDGYSCGTRRKLSTALALIGRPQILLLDEPSSGMDPRTKRHLWKIISEEVKGKCAVVLTSHSMEECEALCSRLAIMVKGQFRCLGSLQHIKNRFGSGFTVKMYLAEASCDAEAITDFMRCRFPSTYLKDQHSTMLEYHVPIAPGGVADIFDQLESNKNALQIKHFSVSQTTLDEVFINFAMGKVAMDSVSLGSEDDSDDQDFIKTVET